MAGCWLRIRGPHPKCHVTFRSCSYVAIQKLIFPQPKALSSPHLAGQVLRLRCCDAQSQMTLLFLGHVKKKIFIFTWHWLKLREHPLKIYNSRDTSMTWQIGRVIANFLIQNNLNFFFFVLLVCIYPVHKLIVYKSMHSLEIFITKNWYTKWKESRENKRTRLYGTSCFYLFFINKCFEYSQY